MPRSGVWHLTGKKAPHWNRPGQYGSLAGDPPFATPAEAQQALEELQASLDAAPPDEPRQISLPYPSPKFKTLFDFHVFAVAEKQAPFQSVTGGPDGLSDLSLDWSEGMLSLGRPSQAAAHRPLARFVGVLDVNQAYWQLGWFSVRAGTLSPSILNSARVLREYGKAHEIPELTYALIPLVREDAPGSTLTSGNGLRPHLPGRLLRRDAGTGHTRTADVLACHGPGVAFDAAARIQAV